MQSLLKSEIWWIRNVSSISHFLHNITTCNFISASFRPDNYVLAKNVVIVRHQGFGNFTAVNAGYSYRESAGVHFSVFVVNQVNGRVRTMLAKSNHFPLRGVIGTGVYSVKLWHLMHSLTYMPSLYSCSCKVSSLQNGQCCRFIR